MTSARERQEWVEGYEAPIKRALWERITSFGVPRLWATLWMVCCLYVGLLVMVGLGFTWLVVPAWCGCWAMGCSWGSRCLMRIGMRWCWRN